VCVCMCVCVCVCVFGCCGERNWGRDEMFAECHIVAVSSSRCSHVAGVVTVPRLHPVLGTGLQNTPPKKHKRHGLQRTGEKVCEALVKKRVFSSRTWCGIDVLQQVLQERTDDCGFVDGGATKGGGGSKKRTNQPSGAGTDSQQNVSDLVSHKKDPNKDKKKKTHVQKGECGGNKTG
jgi:hypothetical protein